MFLPLSDVQTNRPSNVAEYLYQKPGTNKIFITCKTESLVEYLKTRYPYLEDKCVIEPLYVFAERMLEEKGHLSSKLKEKKQLFTTMFGEMAISKNGFAETLPENWSKHGINVESDKCSVISILFKAYEEEAAFVGHTGILIDCRNIESVDSNYLFVEKIAFGDPFKITLVKDENDLIELLSERPDYTSEEGDPAPVVYKNGERIGELKR